MASDHVTHIEEFVVAGGLISYGTSSIEVPEDRTLHRPQFSRVKARPTSPAVHEARTGHQSEPPDTLGLKWPEQATRLADEVIE